MTLPPRWNPLPAPYREVTVDGATFPADDPELVRVAFPDTEGGQPLGPAIYCQECGESYPEELSPDAQEWAAEPCPDSDQLDDDDEPVGPHNTAGAQLAWLNSAQIHLDPDHDEVTVTVSVGDPRGALAMTVGQDDDGHIYVHVPHPDAPMPHLRDLRHFDPADPRGAMTTRPPEEDPR